jgi:O-acetyl-ADP-ribose deacetylase (regulator of RNase III)
MKRLFKRIARRLWRLVWHPIVTVRGWRWGRAESRSDHDLSGYRTPAQVCPRGCEFRELARRDLLAKTRLLGRAALHAAFTFETTNCPECGSRLARQCARCEETIFAPVKDRCQFCGLPQPWATERRAGAERPDVRIWRPPPKDDAAKDRTERANDPAEKLYHAPGRGSLWILEADVARLAVDAVVSNNDVDGRMWAQVARSIKNAAGEGVERLAQEGRPFKLGDAWVTSPGGLDHINWIIHVASMSRRGETDLKTVRECLIAALACATEKNCASLGIAAIGSGPAAIDPHEWYLTFAEVIIGYLSDRSVGPTSTSPVMDVVLALFEPSDFAVESAAVRKAVYSAWRKAGKPLQGRPEWRPPGLRERLRRSLGRWRKRLSGRFLYGAPLPQPPAR